MTELHGTFDAAKADWSKLFGEAPKSIDDIDVIGLHDKTIGKKREFVAIDRVLESIEKELNEFANSVCKDLPHKEEESIRVITAMFMIRCKQAVDALKGEQE